MRYVRTALESESANAVRLGALDTQNTNRRVVGIRFFPINASGLFRGSGEFVWSETVEAEPTDNMKLKRTNLTRTISGTLLRAPAFRLCFLALAGAVFGIFGSSSAEGCERVAFTVADQLPLNGRSLNVVVADFNGDSTADFAATNDQDVIVYLGDGAGGFGTANTFPAGTLPRGLALGDFDGDDKPDLAVANYSDVSILINDGQGGFKAPVNYAADNSP